MTPEEKIKKAIEGYKKGENSINFVSDATIIKKPKAFTAGDHEVCPFDKYKNASGTIMLSCFDENLNVWSASYNALAPCFGESEADILALMDKGQRVKIHCEITPADQTDLNTYNMLKAQGKTKEELNEAGFPFKPSDRRTFTVA